MNLTGITSPEQLIARVSSETDGLFGMGIWGALYVVLFITITITAAKAGSDEPAKEAFLASSLLMAVVSYLMGVLGWINGWFTLVPTVATVIGLIVVTLKN